MKEIPILGVGVWFVNLRGRVVGHPTWIWILFRRDTQGCDDVGWRVWTGVFGICIETLVIVAAGSIIISLFILGDGGSSFPREEKEGTLNQSKDRHGRTGR